MKLLLTICTMLFALVAFAQPTKLGKTVDYSNPHEYRIAGITVTGAAFTDVQAVKLFSGLQVGDRINIPGDEITKAVKTLWDQQLFADIAIYAAETRGEDIYLVIDVVEMPRLSKYSFTGIKRSERENLKEKISLMRGKIVNENL